MTNKFQLVFHLEAVIPLGFESLAEAEEYCKLLETYNNAELLTLLEQTRIVAKDYELMFNFNHD